MGRPSFRTSPLAIVGMACRFPGADNLDEFWSLLRDGRSGIAEVPPDRLDQSLYFYPQKGRQGTSYTRVGGIVPLRPPDPAILPLSSDLARRYDLFHLTICEVAAAACRHAGYDPLRLPYRQTGVFVGNSSGSDLESDLAFGSYGRQLSEALWRIVEFAEVPESLQETLIQDVAAAIRQRYGTRADCPVRDFAPHVAAHAISKLLGLSGPSVVIDAACASSFAALQAGAHALHSGQAEMALVAAAGYRNWFELVLMSQVQSISAEASRPFDSRANGLIAADGYGAVVVKTLSRALADGDRIYGVVRGIGMSSDGRGKGFWAPRQEGQVEAIRRAYVDGLDASRLAYVEAHATSTQVGDATEVAALSQALSEYLPPGTKLPISSVKANIGHTLETAGMAGLIKTLLAMQNGVIPPIINYKHSNPSIDWKQVPFFLPSQQLEWPLPEDGHPRRAAIDSFGIGGLNMHVVVDQAPAETPARFAPDPAVIGGSAHQTDAEQPIAIVGMGAVLPGANSVDAFWELLESGRDPKTPAPFCTSDMNSAPVTPSVRGTPPRGGFLTDYEFDWKRFRIPPKQVAAADPLQFLLLDVVDQALVDAGFDGGKLDGRRVGAVVGSIFGGGFAVDTYLGVRLPEFRRCIREAITGHGLPEELAVRIGEAYTEDFLSRHPAACDETASLSPSTLASRITKQFDLTGGAFAIDAGGTSALAALAASIHLLRTGECDTVVCAAGQKSMDPTAYEQLGLTGAESPDAIGYVPGEGAAVVILKRLEDARRDGDRIRAVLHGCEMCADTRSVEKAVGSAIRRGLAATGVRPDQVSIAELIAPVTPDLIERDSASPALQQARGIAAAYGNREGKPPLLGGSLVAQIGHLGGAAGMAALIKLVLALEHGRMPVTFGIKGRQPDSTSHFKPLNLLADASPVHATTDRGTSLAAVTAFSDSGFGGDGGVAAHLLLEGGTQLSRPLDVDAETRRQSITAESAMTNSTTAPSGATAAGSDDLDRLLVDFFAEQTGVPREIIDFDDEPAVFAGVNGDPDNCEAILAELEARLRSQYPNLTYDVRSHRNSTLRQLRDALLQEIHQSVGLSVRASDRNSTVECPESRVGIRSASAPSPPLDSGSWPLVHSTDSPTDRQTHRSDLLQTAGDPQNNAPPTTRRMSRFILRMVDAPLPEGTAENPVLHGPVLILGANPDAEALEERLTGLGATVYRLGVYDDDGQTLDELEAVWQQGPAPHLFLMTARDQDAAVNCDDPAAWRLRQDRGLMLPLRVCQSWFAKIADAELFDRATLAAATALGGDFGLAGHSSACEGGGVAGLLKAVDVETRGKLRVKVVDAPAREPAKLVARELCQEIAIQSADRLGQLDNPYHDVEIGYVRGRRRVVRAVRYDAALYPRRQIERGSTWVVTGGARGVTALVARELGRRLGLKLHVLGSSPRTEIEESWRNLSEDGLKQLRAQIVKQALAENEPPQEAWAKVEKAIEIDANLRSFEQAGVRVTYHACDVSDRDRLADVLDTIRQNDGPIYGVIHGAGIELASSFQKKRPEMVSKVLSSKVDGAFHLLDLTRPDKLRFFIGFGSTSGRYGGYIQTDYSAANEMLAKLVNAYRQRNPDCAAFTVHWTAWDDVGMGNRSRSRFILDAMNVQPMSPAEGVEHLVDEICAESHESEVVITDHPGGVHDTHVVMPSPEECRDWPVVQKAVAAAPLIDCVRAHEAGGGGMAYSTFDPTRDPFMLGHLDEGVPLLPAVIGIEMCAEAAAILAGGRRVIGLRDVRLVNGFRMATPALHRATIRVEPGDTENEFACSLSGEFYDKQGILTDPDRLYQSATVVLADQIPELPPPQLGDPPEDWMEVPYPDDWRDMQGANSGTVYYGRELRCLKFVHHDADGAWGRLIAPPPAEIGGRRQADAWQTPPSFLDALLFGCDLFASYSFGTKQLPQVIDSIRFGRLPRAGEHCLSRTFFHGRDGRRLSWDFWALGEDGSVILFCEGCHFVDLNISLQNAIRSR